MIRWRIPRSALKAKGIENPNQLARAAGIGYPNAVAIMAEVQPPRQRIDVHVLESVANALDISNPLDLLHFSAR